MTNEVEAMSVCVCKMPSKGQETRHAANYPDMNPRSRAISMSCNHSSDVLTGGKEVDGLGSWQQTLPACTVQSPRGIHESPIPKLTLRDLIHLAWSQADWLKPFLKPSPWLHVCVWRNWSNCKSEDLNIYSSYSWHTDYFILFRRQQHLYWISKNWFL